MKEDMVRGLASFLAREVQQPIMSTLQKSKGASAPPTARPPARPPASAGCARALRRAHACVHGVWGVGYEAWGVGCGV